MLSFLIKREFQYRYTGNMAGLAWAVMNPLLSSLAMVMIFSVFMASKMQGSRYSEFTFAAYYFVGFAGWFVFSDGIGRSLGLIKQNGGILKSMRFSSERFVWAALAVSVFSALVVLILALAVAMSIDNVHWGTYWWTAPFWIALLAAFTLGMMYVFASATLFFPDLSQAIPILLNFWFFATPLLYTVETARAAFPPWVASVILANPMSVLIEGLRSALVLPEIGVTATEVGFAIAATLALLVGGRAMFLKLEPQFNDVM